MTSQDPDRVPLSHSVRYAVRGLPEVPHRHYGRGVLVPSEITLTYRASPDSQLGRIHAYVAGRIHVDGTEIPHDGLYGQHYDEGLDDWPHWLTEEARLHDPDAAPVSRSAVLLEAADAVAADTAHIRYGSAKDYAKRHAALLRRLAPEAHDETRDETVHACPPYGSGLTPCCGRTPFELPRNDRISSEEIVTCPGVDASVVGRAQSEGADRG